MKTKTILSLAMIAATSALACWVELPLETVIRQSHVVVIGEITSITVADPPETEDQYLLDVANIRVQEVLHNTLTNRVIKPKQMLPLSMPSTRNKHVISTDIRFKPGQKGIWILQWRDETFWATYPKDFQPLSEEKDVRAIVKTLKEESSIRAGGH